MKRNVVQEQDISHSLFIETNGERVKLHLKV